MQPHGINVWFIGYLTPSCLRRGAGSDQIPRRWGKREICLTLHCHHQNDSCIKMGSDESRFDVSLTVRDTVTGQCPPTTTLEERGDP